MVRNTSFFQKKKLASNVILTRVSASGLFQGEGSQGSSAEGAKFEPGFVFEVLIQALLFSLVA